MVVGKKAVTPFCATPSAIVRRPSKEPSEASFAQIAVNVYVKQARQYIHTPRVNNFHIFAGAIADSVNFFVKQQAAAFLHMVGKDNFSVYNRFHRFLHICALVCGHNRERRAAKISSRK